MLKLALVIFIFASASGIIAAQSKIGPENYTSQYANSLVQNVSSYIASVNESSYLIFQPNLAGAYKNLSFAISNVSYNPSAAVLYAEHANQSAYNQYMSIEYYKSISLPIIVAFTVIMALLLYRFMTPVKTRQKRR